MIKIEFPSHRSDIALAIGQALITIAQGERQEMKAPKVSAESTAEERAELYKHTPDPAPGETVIRADATGQHFEHTGKTDEPMEAVEELDEPERTDENGVEFDAKYCANAADPFYATGKQKGQWKKRKGVDEADYNAWYASQLQDAPEQLAKDEPEPQPEKAAAAFKKAPAVATDAPKNFPELMTWFAGQQAAGNYEAQHLEKAFRDLGISTLDLVQDATGEKVRAVYEHLA